MDGQEQGLSVCCADFLRAEIVGARKIYGHRVAGPRSNLSRPVRCWRRRLSVGSCRFSSWRRVIKLPGDRRRWPCRRPATRWWLFRAPVLPTPGCGDPGGEILVQRYTEAGTALGDVLPVNSITAGEQSEPAVVADAEGNFLVVWSGRGGGDRTGIFGQRFNQSGSPPRPTVPHQHYGGRRADSTSHRHGSGWPGHRGPGRVLVRGTPSGIWLQRLATDGTLAGEETLVNHDDRRYAGLSVGGHG